MKKFLIIVGLVVVFISIGLLSGARPARVAADAPQITCDSFSFTVETHALYRFTSFSRIGSYVVSPPNPASTTGSRGSWAGLASGSDYQSGEIKYYEDYDDSQGGFSSTYLLYFMNFPLPSGPDRYMLAEWWTHDLSTDGWTYHNQAFSIDNCYSASCKISVDGVGGTSNVVEVKKKFKVHASITNTGHASLPEEVASYHLGLTGTSDSYFYPGSKMIDAGNPFDIGSTYPKPGETYSIPDFTLDGPNKTGGPYQLKAYPDYLGRFRLGAACEIGGGLLAGKAYGITPFAKIDTNDDENPANIPYTTGGKKTDPKSKDIAATNHSWLTFEKGDGSGSVSKLDPTSGTHDKAYTYGPDYSESFNSPLVAGGVKAGDRYCAHITIDPGIIFVDDAGKVLATAPASANSPCLTIHNKPYAHFLGADVSAGGGFGTACKSTPGGIYTYLKATGKLPIGSGGQLAAIARKESNGFSSASLRNSLPLGSVGLSFANTKDIGGSPPDGGLGGKLGSSIDDCFPDYWARMPLPTAKVPSYQSKYPGAPANPGGKLSQVSQFFDVSKASGTLTIDANTIDKGLNLTLYVSGNVVIKGDQKYKQTKWDDQAAVPSLFIIAKGGDIYIDSSVTQLDGIYIAQPNGAKGGNIYTCAGGTTGWVATNADLSAACSQQLVVNGAFVSKKTYLSRSFGSLRDSLAGERLNVGKSRTCTSNRSSANTDKDDCAAEIFNFGPEVYLAQPDLRPFSGPKTFIYDSITSLPPVL